VLLGTYQANVGITAVATLGIIAATLYGLKVTSNVFQGPNRHNWTLPDLFPREWVIIGSMMACLLWVGLYPQSFIRVFQSVSQNPLQSIASAQRAGR